MPKYHYSVHVISRTPNVDATLWVGVNLDEKYESDESFVPDDSVLGKAAIAQARKLCPALKDCTCEEWSKHYEPDYSDDIRKFLGDDYEEKAKKLKRLAEPLFKALDKTGMQLAIDSRSENHLIVIPWRNEYCGEVPKDVPIDELLDETITIGDGIHLVSVLG